MPLQDTCTYPEALPAWGLVKEGSLEKFINETRQVPLQIMLDQRGGYFKQRDGPTINLDWFSCSGTIKISYYNYIEESPHFGNIPTQP